MKIIFSLLCLLAACVPCRAKQLVYQGSTPAHLDVRKFLNISLTDSIDFIKWQLAIETDKYELNCRYGLAKGGTDGFTNEKQIRLAGTITKRGYHYMLNAGGRSFFLLQINSNLLHLLDQKQNLLVGNGSYSYTLNIDSPVKSDQLNISLKQAPLKAEAAFEGRTPCQELSKMMGLNKTAACDKMKWYIIFVIDPITGKPSHYLKGGRAYKRETMSNGKWETFTGKDGRIMFKLDPEKINASTYLVKVDENILLFTDPEGNLMVGNKNFSYTLNRIRGK